MSREERRIEAVERSLEWLKEEVDKQSNRVDRLQCIHEWVVNGTEAVEKLWQEHVEQDQKKEYWKVKEALPEALAKEVTEYFGMAWPIKTEGLPEKNNKRAKLVQALQALLTPANIANVKIQRGKGKCKGKDKGKEKGKSKGAGKGKGKDKDKCKGKAQITRAQKTFKVIVKPEENALKLHTLITKPGLEQELVARSKEERTEEEQDCTMEEEGGESERPSAEDPLAGSYQVAPVATKTSKKKKNAAEASKAASETTPTAASTPATASVGSATAVAAWQPRKTLLIFQEKTRQEKAKIREKKRAREWEY